MSGRRLLKTQSNICSGGTYKLGKEFRPGTRRKAPKFNIAFDAKCPGMVQISRAVELSSIKFKVNHIYFDSRRYNFSLLKPTRYLKYLRNQKHCLFRVARPDCDLYLPTFAQYFIMRAYPRPPINPAQPSTPSLQTKGCHIFFWVI